MKTKMYSKILAGILIVVVLLVGIGTVMAHENFTETKQLIDSNISCDKLNEEQLDEIGDYYMEQMHPGEAHELMHEMMGGEDSETVKLMHINMAKGIYCGEQNQGMMGMMSMMMGGNMTSSGGMMGNNMMGGGMMSSGMMSGNMMNRGMMGNYPYTSNIYSSITAAITATLINILLIVLIAVIIVLLIKSLKIDKR